MQKKGELIKCAALRRQRRFKRPPHRAAAGVRALKLLISRLYRVPPYSTATACTGCCTLTKQAEVVCVCVCV